MIQSAHADLPELYKWVAQSATWLLPLVLLGLQFSYKLLVFERGTWSKTWEAALHLPIDICFLSISFVAAHIMLRPASIHAPLVLLLIYVLLALVSILLWKLCPKEYGKAAIGKAIACTAFNLFMSIVMFYVALDLYAGSK